MPSYDEKEEREIGYWGIIIREKENHRFSLFSLLTILDPKLLYLGSYPQNPEAERAKNGARTTERLLISSDVPWVVMTTPNLAGFWDEPSLTPQGSIGRGSCEQLPACSPKPQATSRTT